MNKIGSSGGHTHIIMDSVMILKFSITLYSWWCCFKLFHNLRKKDRSVARQFVDTRLFAVWNEGKPPISGDYTYVFHREFQDDFECFLNDVRKGLIDTGVCMEHEFRVDFCVAEFEGPDFERNEINRDIIHMGKTIDKSLVLYKNKQLHGFYNQILKLKDEIRALEIDNFKSTEYLNVSDRLAKSKLGKFVDPFMNERLYLEHHRMEKYHEKYCEYNADLNSDMKIFLSKNSERHRLFSTEASQALKSDFKESLNSYEILLNDFMSSCRKRKRSDFFKGVDTELEHLRECFSDFFRSIEIPADHCSREYISKLWFDMGCIHVDFFCILKIGIQKPWAAFYMHQIGPDALKDPTAITDHILQHKVIYGGEYDDPKEAAMCVDFMRIMEGGSDTDKINFDVRQLRAEARNRTRRNSV